MLTFDVKKKINTLRDILVGKVPDPKAQVEQITIALIYKFMDDMDIAGIDFGGRQFFVEEYEKYAWTNIMSPQVGGKERIIRYGEGMEAMQRNPNLPQLFRDIFKNAYLPYRDSETLNLFLSEINEFKYDNSEDLGNAFEYLLSIMGSQGDAGQFRTPRHIIDMMVRIIKPKKTEKILDPACGTAGFLISAYKYVLADNTDEFGEDKLTADERTKMTKNFVGYDISPDMVRLSRVNMYLHRFVKPQIFEYDTLTSKDRWKDTFDCILANPPFMTPKGGINPHNMFRVQANRSEVLFTDYIVEHLSSNGRAAIIVPEGVVFQSATAYKNLRKYLLEGMLYAVISMPSGVFNPYSGVKTSILLVDKSIATQADKILFLKMNSDGFDLGAQRRDLGNRGDIDEIISICENFRKSIIEKTEFTTNSKLVTLATKQQISDNDFVLVGDRYKIAKVYDTNYPMVKLGDVCISLKNGVNVEQKEEGKYSVTRIQTISDGTMNLKKVKFTDDEVVDDVFMQEGDILLSHINSFEHLAKTAIFHGCNLKVIHGINLLKLRPNATIIKPEYLIRILKSCEFIEKARTFAQKAVNQASLRSTDVSNMQIPLPPIEIQEQIVAEIESYQKIIDGAKQVVDNYRPTIKIDPTWEMVLIGDICVFNPKKSELGIIEKSTKVSFVPMDKLNCFSIKIDKTDERELSEVYGGYTYFAEVDVLLAKVTPCFENGKIGIATGLKNGIGFGSSEFYVFRPNKKINAMWIWLNLISDSFRTEAINHFTGTGGLKRLSKNYVANFEIPLPPIEIQNQIVAEIEEEQKAVAECKKLIEKFEAKITAKINDVWGE